MKRTVLISLLVVAMVFGVIAYAGAATDDVVVSAVINSKVVVTAPADHSFGTFDPDAANPAGYTANVNVRSNIDYKIGHALNTTAPADMFSVTLPAGIDNTTNQPKAPSVAGRDYSVTWNLDLTPAGDWVDAGTYTATSTFTTTP